MSCVKAWTENFLDPDVVVSASVSSEQAAYPASNLYDEKRFKPWRSNGQWEVTASNNIFIFQETIAVNLVAVIPVGTYADDAAFFSAVEFSFSINGSSVYTVSRDTTTNKIKILSDLSGGGGVFRLIWTNGAVTAADLLGFDTASDDTGAAFYIADDLRIHTSETVTWDLGIPSNPKGFIAIGLRNRPIKITSGAVIKLQGCSTSNFSSPEFEQTVPYFENALAIENPNGLHTSGLRYWRLYIEDVANPYGYVELGEIFLGDYLDLTRGNVVFPFSNTLGDRSAQMVSEGGQVYAMKIAATQRFQLQWQGLLKADLEILEAIFNAYGFNKPLFVSFDSDGVFSTDPETWVRFCRFDSEMEFQLVSPDNFSASWNLKEEL